jgi:hypothetical protein
MPQVAFGNTIISYVVRRSSNRETVGLAVDPDEGVVVTAPDDVSEDTIREIVRSRAAWIFEKQARIEELEQPPLKKEFLSGEKLSYLGRRYRLQIIKNGDHTTPTVTLKEGKFYVSIDGDGEDRRKTIRQALIAWYRQHARAKLAERVGRYADKVGVTPRSVEVKNQQKRWGSCTKTGDLLFNWRIIMAPMSIVDYVVVHELCHLKEENHTERFWRMLKTVIPDYEERKEWLRINGPKLVF